MFKDQDNLGQLLEEISFFKSMQYFISICSTDFTLSHSNLSAR